MIVPSTIALTAVLTLPLMDNGTAMRKALNALLTPRFYLIDARAKLLDIQSDPNVKPPFVHWREGRR